MREDIKQQCLWIIRGHSARVGRYHVKRNNVLYGSASSDHMPNASKVSDTVANRTILLAKIEQHPETLRMRAVETAINSIGNDITSEIERMKLVQAILINCKSGRMHPYESLGLHTIDRNGFYRRKKKFLQQVANELELE